MTFKFSFWLTVGFLVTVSLAEIPDEVVLTHINQLPKAQLPTDFTWQNVNNTNFLTLDYNENLPQYCDASWVVSVTSMMSDRIKVARNAQWPDVNVSTQFLLACLTGDNAQGCDGGDSLEAIKFISDVGIVDYTCNAYLAEGWTQGRVCDDTMVCWLCRESGKCVKPDEFYKYSLTDYGKVDTEEGIMNEIHQRGPVACTINRDDALRSYTGGVVSSTLSAGQDLQNVEVVGWSQENDVPYWIARNSWGTAWGENGYIRIAREKDSTIDLGGCQWVVPSTDFELVSEMNVPTEEMVPQPEISFLEAFPTIDEGLMMPTSMNDFESVFSDLPHVTGLTEDHIVTPLPKSYLKPEDLPANFWWGDVEGVNYLSWTRNQHNTVYCGSCWTHAATSSLSDRLNILNKGQSPGIVLSIQTVLNCWGGGTCDAGNSHDTYKFAYEHGIPDSTCQIYTASHPVPMDCSAANVCKSCNTPPSEDGTDNCTAVESPTLYKVSEYGSLYGDVFGMKTEIFARGPISCHVQVGYKFHQYRTGVLEDYSPNVEHNHTIAVVGWGFDEESGEEYWVGRNSFGTYWGEMGFFKVVMGRHDYNLGIEDRCDWGVPILPDTTQG